MTHQTQKGGMGSSNLQINVEQHGLSYVDVRNIAKDVFNQNFQVLANQAADIAEARANSIRDDIMAALAAHEKARLDTFIQPDRQIALLDAQKAYVLTGDDTLKTMLVRLVTDLSEQEARDLRAIVIQEAIKTVPTLTTRQLNLLAVTYFCRYSVFPNINSLDHLNRLFQDQLFNRVKIFEMTDGDVRHLEYARCGKASINSVDYYSSFRRSYLGLLQKGLSSIEMIARFEGSIPTQGHMLCLNNSELVQIAALNEDVIGLKAKEFNWTDQQKSKSLEILTNNAMDNVDSRALLLATNQKFGELFSFWEETGVKHLELTSVGITIAYSYIGSTGADLSIWL